jgi:4-azaleucine resistance transporter AzlC
VSVGVATGAYGISFGALSVAAGFSVLQTQVLSLLLFTGGSQFAVVGVIGAGGSGLSAVAASTMLGVRNGLYGLETSRMLQVRGWRRLVAAHLTIDESTAVGMSQQEPDERRLGFWTAGIAVFVLWNLLTLLGAGIGNALGDPTRWGLDAAAAAAFIALLWPRLRSRDARATGVLAGLIALALSPVTRPGIPVLVAVVAALVVGVVSTRPLKDAR